MDIEQNERRRLLKILGLGVAFLPFISCFEEDQSRVGKVGKQQLQRPETDEAPRQPPDEVGEEDLVLLSREDKAYEQFNVAFNRRVRHLPRYIAVCKTEKGVQYALQKAKAENLKVAVKSGGHSFEGFSSNDGGMVINLSRMKKISWVSDDEVIVQPGCLLREIQAELFPRKKLLPAGSCGTVGIAGLTLGGGYGFFSRKYGLTCDSLLQLDMVGADGKIYNTAEHKELLWACKGAGNGNFGVVTSFRFRLHQMPPTFDSYVLKFRNMNPEKFETSLSTWFDVSGQLPQEAFAAYVLNGKTLTILITSYRNYKDFERNIAPIVMLADSKSITLDAPLPAAMKRYYGKTHPIFFKNASAGLYECKEDVLKIKEALFSAVIHNPGIIFQVNTLGGAIADKDFEAASCYPHRRSGYLGELQAYWEQESQESRLLAAFEEIQTLFRESGIGAHYSNYPDMNFKDWETAYYGEHYERLRELKRKYDPDELFQYPQGIKG